MNASNKVGEIFTAAGSAFSKLGELTMQLHPASEPSPGGKWTDPEVEMLRQAVVKFGEDLNKLSGLIKTRRLNQLKTSLKRKAYDEAGLSPPEEKMVQPQLPSPQKQAIVKKSPKSAPSKAEQKQVGEVTLSALNAPEGDVDIEGLNDQTAAKKLEFDSDVDSSLL